MGRRLRLGRHRWTRLAATGHARTMSSAGSGIRALSPLSRDRGISMMRGFVLHTPSQQPLTSCVRPAKSSTSHSHRFLLIEKTISFRNKPGRPGRRGSRPGAAGRAGSRPPPGDKHRRARRGPPTNRPFVWAAQCSAAFSWGDCSCVSWENHCRRSFAWVTSPIEAAEGVF